MMIEKRSPAIEPDIRSYVAVYTRYHRRETYECRTVDEALRFLKDGEDCGDLSTICVMQGDDVLYDNGQFIEMYMNDSWPWESEEEAD